ncbi:histidine phosphatase family protein [Mycobacterium sp. 21AC1]|uniref:histidine phosphatase family protein n=1 Tax=[Mycobacterium] appelbergii TaxID=2939269 RepID=UPI0029390E54|nr:histidine phosphatase family protein [Mycobacterium sp. 21AC1]MDV3125335.1 histidine phosphatase family protein [Mycobacterium sp. 21AC1]
MRADTLWVRHGESTWNRAGVMQGQTHWPALTSRGGRQARAVVDELLDYRPVRIVSSDLRRAAETAHIIGARLALPVEFTALLRERCWGVFEGRPAAEGRLAESALKADQPVPHGESRDDVVARLRRLAPALTTADGPTVVVTHGDVIRAALSMWQAHRADDTPPENGCIVPIPAELMNPHSTRSRQA